MIWCTRRHRVVVLTIGAMALLFICFRFQLSSGKIMFAERLGEEEVPGIPGYQEIIRMSSKQLEQVYIKYLNTTQLYCKKRVRYGNKEDGGWFICEDDPYKPPINSLVYSFGINRDFSFDDAISTGNFKARVHSFDPSDGIGDHKRSERVMFHAIGIGGHDHKSKQGWKIKTLDSIQKALGHKTGEVRVLKMDIEGNEIDAMEQILKTGSLKGTKQLMLEWHIPHINYGHQSSCAEKEKLFFIRALNIFIQLYKFGFSLYWKDDNLHCRAKNSRIFCHEAYYVQTR